MSNRPGCDEEEWTTRVWDSDGAGLDQFFDADAVGMSLIVCAWACLPGIAQHRCPVFKAREPLPLQ